MARSASSLSARCSTISATDQRSGAGLKFHCSSVNPAVACTRACRVSRRCWRAKSRSAGVSCCPLAAGPASSARNPTRKSLLMVLPPVRSVVSPVAYCNVGRSNFSPAEPAYSTIPANQPLVPFQLFAAKSP